jgi:hypothetical protein
MCTLQRWTNAMLPGLRLDLPARRTDRKFGQPPYIFTQTVNFHRVRPYLLYGLFHEQDAHPLQRYSTLLGFDRGQLSFVGPKPGIYLAISHDGTCGQISFAVSQQTRLTDSLRRAWREHPLPSEICLAAIIGDWEDPFSAKYLSGAHMQAVRQLLREVHRENLRAFRHIHVVVTSDVKPIPGRQQYYGFPFEVCADLPAPSGACDDDHGYILQVSPSDFHKSTTT